MTQETVSQKATIESMLIDAADFVSEMEKALNAADNETIALNMDTLTKLISDMAENRAKLSAMEQRARAVEIRAKATMA